jgi:hypothetical protein
MSDGDKIHWLQAENARLRQELAQAEGHGMVREVRPRSSFDASDMEARTLVAKAQGAYPALAWWIPPGSAVEEIQRKYLQRALRERCEHA